MNSSHINLVNKIFYLCMENIHRKFLFHIFDWSIQNGCEKIFLNIKIDQNIICGNEYYSSSLIFYLLVRATFEFKKKKK